MTILFTRRGIQIMLIVEFFALTIAVIYLYSAQTVASKSNLVDLVENLTFQTAISSRDAKRLKSKTILLYGADSFLGSKVAVALHQSGYQIKPIEDMDNIPLEPMAWYRWQKLQDLELNPQYVDMNSIGNVFFNKHQIGAIVFIPTPLFDGISSPDKLFKLNTVSRTLKNFVHLLERSKSSKVKVVMLGLSELLENSIQRSWLRAFELSLSVYRLFGVQTGLIRMDGVYGPWEGEGDNVYPIPSCSYIEQVESAVLDVLSAGERHVVIDVTDHCSEQTESWNVTKLWADEHTKFLKSRKDVVMSTYFTGERNPSHPFQLRPRNGLFMKKWFASAVRQGLNLVIFHDNLDKEFRDRIRNINPKNTEFVRVESMNGRSTNDYRFYLAYQYLLEHPEIRRAILTDMRDVKFVGDPFNQMEVIGDYLYIGVDKPFYMSGFEYEWVRNLMKKCHKADSTIDAVKLYPFLNAGVSGGTRHSLLAFLNLMTHYFDESPHHENCNMGILSIVCHRHFHDNMFNGYPFQRSFAVKLAPPQGLSIKHKNGEKYNVYY